MVKPAIAASSMLGREKAPGSDPEKKLHYAGFERSHWLKNIEQPIRVLKMSVA